MRKWKGVLKGFQSLEQGDYIAIVEEINHVLVKMNIYFNKIHWSLKVNKEVIYAKNIEEAKKKFRESIKLPQGKAKWEEIA